MGNIVPIHKRGDKQTLKSYLPVPLLPICGKIIERLLFNKMLFFLLKINLSHQISPVLNRAMNQLLSITHEMHESFNAGFEVRNVFLDISKAFDK